LYQQLGNSLSGQNLAADTKDIGQNLGFDTKATETVYLDRT
jgi:hypothetical protein